MSQNPKSPSPKPVRRNIDLDTEVDVETYGRASRADLIHQLKETKALLANMVGEMRVQENRMNECVRIVSHTYEMIYGTVAEYAATVWWNERVNKNVHYLPPAWFASRVQKFSEMLFETYDLKGLSMRPPPRELAGNMFIADEPLNPGSKLYQAMCSYNGEINKQRIQAAFIDMMQAVPLPDTHKQEFLNEVVEHADAKTAG